MSGFPRVGTALHWEGGGVSMPQGGSGTGGGGFPRDAQISRGTEISQEDEGTKKLNWRTPRLMPGLPPAVLKEQGECQPCPQLDNACQGQRREVFAEQSSGFGQT